MTKKQKKLAHLDNLFGDIWETEINKRIVNLEDSFEKLKKQLLPVEKENKLLSDEDIYADRNTYEEWLKRKGLLIQKGLI